MPLITVATAIRQSPVPLLRASEVPHPERALAHGSLVRVRRGVYAPAGAWNALPPWDRYLARVHAVALVAPDAVFCLEAAAALIGMPIFGDPVIVHVLVSASSSSRFVSGVRTHKSMNDRTIVEVGGLVLTSPLDTAIDLARHRHPAIGLSAADAALRLMSATPTDLLTVNDARRSSRGRDVARWSVSRATAQAESPLESVSRATIEWLGLPEPELQVHFHSESDETDRGDMLWPHAGLVGEADGDLKYDGRYGDARAVLRRQTARDNRLRAQSGVRAVVHWGWTEATTVDPLRNLLLGAGLTPVRPEQPGPLHSLKGALRSHAPHHTAPPSGKTGRRGAN